MGGTVAEFERSTLRTLGRDTFNIRAILSMLTFLAFSSRIAARCRWFSTFFFLLLLDPLRHPAEFAARLLDLLLRLLQLRAVHFRHRYADPAVGALRNGGEHFQIARERGGLGDRLRLRLALRFQKQFRGFENALANLTRTLAPSRVQLPGFARGAMLRGKSSGHALAIVHVDARCRHKILHRQLRRDLSFADLLLDGFR